MSSDEKLKPVQAAALGFGLAVLCGVIWKTVTSEGASSSQQGRGSAVVDVDALDRDNQRYDQRCDLECIEKSFGRAYELLTNLPSFLPSFLPSSFYSLCPIPHVSMSHPLHTPPCAPDSEPTPSPRLSARPRTPCAGPSRSVLPSCGRSSRRARAFPSRRSSAATLVSASAGVGVGAGAGVMAGTLCSVQAMSDVLCEPY